MMGSIFAKCFIMFLWLSLLLPSDCSGIRDGEEKKTHDAVRRSYTYNIFGDAEIQLVFNHSHGRYINPIDVDASYSRYVDESLISQKSLILCAVTNYEAAFPAEIDAIMRTKATVLCTLPAKSKSLMANESSMSYTSRHMYQITRQIAGIIGNRQWLETLKSETLKTCCVCFCEESDRVSDLEIVTFNLKSHPTQNRGEIIIMAATLSFSTTRPLLHFADLTIAVPARLIPTQFVNISHDVNHEETQITGFWIDVFKAAVEMLPIANITYKLVPFYGSNDQLFKEVARKTFDAAVGLTVVTEEWFQLVEILRPNLLAIGGSVTVIMKENIELNQVFSFMRPFTNEMWLSMAIMTIFTVFVIWLVEHKTISESGGVPSIQVGAIFWFSFATLFYGGHREPPRKNLTYFVLAPWLFLLLIVGSIYTATFTSMVSSLDTQSSCSSSPLDLGNLKKTNAIIGCDGDPIITRVLVEAVGFQPANIKIISAQSSVDDYAKALSSGYIKAAFISRPYAELFLTKYGKGFKVWCPSRRNAVVFPRGSLLVPYMSDAMARLILRCGKFEQMKKDMLSFSHCSGSNPDGTNKQGIGPEPFLGLFILSGGASAIAILVTVISMMRRRLENCIQRMLMGRGLWAWLTTLLSRNQGRNEIELSRTIASTFQTQQEVSS